MTDTHLRPMVMETKQPWFKRAAKKWIGAAIGMVLSAKPECKSCNGTGWQPDFKERCMVRCSCTDPTEVVMGT